MDSGMFSSIICATRYAKAMPCPYGMPSLRLSVYTQENAGVAHGCLREPAKFNIARIP
jgi:hypothetical protein